MFIDALSLDKWIQGQYVIESKSASEMGLCATLGFEVDEGDEVGSVDTGSISIFEVKN